MAKYSLVKGTTSYTATVFIQDDRSSVGAGLTGLVFNTASLTAYYARPRAAAVAITLATQTVTGAFSSGGFVEIDATNLPGFYRLDLPDAALATGVTSVALLLKGAANMVPCPLEIELTEFNNQAASVTLADGGLTAAKIADDAITAAKVASDVTTEFQSGLATAASITALNNLSSAQVKAQADQALAEYDPPTFTELDARTDAIDAAIAALTIAVAELRKRDTRRTRVNLDTSKEELYEEDGTTVELTWTLKDKDGADISDTSGVFDRIPDA